MKIYQDRTFLYEHYVRKRMNLKDICELLEKNYNTKITTQGLYNWIKKNDLLKYRGKGRKLGANLQKPKGQSMGKSPARVKQERMRQQARLRKRGQRP
jgi:hypothetical protein